MVLQFLIFLTFFFFIRYGFFPPKNILLVEFKMLKFVNDHTALFIKNKQYATV